jgi:hypothetical protein
MAKLFAACFAVFFSYCIAAIKALLLFIIFDIIQKYINKSVIVGLPSEI